MPTIFDNITGDTRLGLALRESLKDFDTVDVATGHLGAVLLYVCKVYVWELSVSFDCVSQLEEGRDVRDADEV